MIETSARDYVYRIWRKFFVDEEIYEISFYSLQWGDTTYTIYGAETFSTNDEKRSQDHW